jgi:uncharacterized membrane protein
MTLLVLGIAIFLGIHLLPTVPGLRDRLAARLGANGYRALVSLLSLAGLALLVYGFAKAPLIEIWTPPPFTRWVAIVLMWPAFVFLAAAYLPGEIKARLKHPFLVAVKTWALAHLIANGDLASIILFGAFLAYAVYDRIALKGRRPTALIAARGPGTRRNDLLALALGTALYLAFLLWLHPLLIGRPALPH